MTKEIKWLAIAEIKRAAAKSRKAALECSIEHWRQLVAAPRKELLDADALMLVTVDEDYCALCSRYMGLECNSADCTRCPVARKYHEYCRGDFGYVKALKEYSRTITEASAFRRWRTAAKKVLRQLTEIAEELKKGK